MHRLPILVLLAAVYACEDFVGPSDRSPDVPNVAPYVTGAAAAAVGAEGRFELSPPSDLALESIIDPMRATRLALAFIRDFVLGPTIPPPGWVGIREGLEHAHGHVVAWADVRAVPGAPYFAESFIPPLSVDVPGRIHRTVGPHYLVPLHVDGDHVATIRVSALAHDIYVNVEGHLVEPGGSDGVWDWLSPLHDWGHSVPPSPEWAVVFAASKTGARVSEVPRLVKPGYRITSLFGYWMLILERPVSLKRVSDNTLQTTDTLYVRNIPEYASPDGNLRLFVAAEEQPDTITLRYRDDDVWREHLAPRRDGFAVKFHEAVPE